LAVEAWDRSQTQRLATGTLAYSDNQIDSATGSIKLKARFNNNDESLFPNQFVNVSLVLAVRKAVPTVPTSAIVRSSQGPVVYKKMPNNTVQSVSVHLGVAEGEYTELLPDTNSTTNSPIAVGDSVVLEGTDRLRDGAKISEPSRSSK
jgi:multidrug efflux system membrane fusion protein